MGVGKFSRPLRGVGVLAMPDSGLHRTRHVESVSVSPPGAVLLRLLVPGGTGGAIIDHCCVAEGMEVTGRVISATRELFSEDEVVEF
jgi:hypothetical protein